MRDEKASERNLIIELVTDLEKNPEKSCPNLNSDSCNGCEYRYGVNLCDQIARKVDYFMAKGLTYSPVKPGDTVYLPFRDDFGDVASYMVDSVTKNVAGDILLRINDEDKNEIPLDEIGKVAFLSAEGAVKAIQDSGPLQCD